MSVYKRKTSKGESTDYHYKFMVKGKYYNGVCKGCTTKREAEKYEADIRNTVNEIVKQKTVKALVENQRDILTGGNPIMLTEAFDLALKKGKKPSQKQIESKRSYWRDFVTFMTDKYPDIKHLANVRKKHAEEYLYLLRESGRYDKKVEYEVGEKDKKTFEYTRNHNLSPRTCNVFHETLKFVFKKLWNDAGLIDNPFDKIDKLPDDSESREPFTEDELIKIKKNADDFNLPIFTIGIATALREGDICTLLWSEIDLVRNVITRKMLKTKRVVEIPIMPPLRDYLLELQKNANGNEYVLPEHAEMYQNNPHGISRRVRLFLESLDIQTRKKIEGRTREVSIKDVHSLRHSFCYYAGVFGIPLLIVKDIVGHMTEEMTDLYQKHASIKEKRKQLEKMSEFMRLLPSVSPKEQEGILEREKLVSLVQTLPIDKVKAILQSIEKESSNDS